MDARFDIRLALTDRDRRAIAHLRQQYASHPRGYELEPAADARPSFDPLDRAGHLFGVFDGSRAVATIRLHVLREEGPVETNSLRLDRFGHYHPDRMAVISGFLIAQHIERDAEMVAQLIRQVLCVAYLHQVEFACGAFDPGWHSLMETLGFRRYLPVADCPELGGGVPMAFVLSDADHLRKCGSPFAALAAAFGSNQFAAVFFRQLVEELARGSNGRKGRRAVSDND